jgi:pSer/pThr/pTyr-binding forkhead associated (FHA) protein
VPESPLDAHVATPQDLKERIAAERRGTPFLVYRDADDLQVIVELAPTSEQLTIGRRPSNDVVLDWDSEISRVHAALERIGEDWTVVDDGLSRNGTYVNGERVNGRRRLRDGDRIVFGETPVLFRAPQDVTDSTAAIKIGGTVQLTETQRRVLVALCRPLQNSAYATPATNKAIADEVFLSVDAVKAHLRVIFERFGLDALPQNEKRGRLAATALVNGVVKPHEF